MAVLDSENGLGMLSFAQGRHKSGHDGFAFVGLQKGKKAQLTKKRAQRGAQKEALGTPFPRKFHD